MSGLDGLLPKFSDYDLANDQGYITKEVINEAKYFTVMS